MAKRRRKYKRNNRLARLGRGVKTLFSLVLKLLPAVIGLAVIAGIFFVVRQLLYADPNLLVTRVTVDPPNALSIATRASLEKELLDRNILQVDLKQLAQSLESDPEIQTVRISRRLPAEIRIDITKRKPMAFIQFSPRGAYGLIAADGMILDTFAVPGSSLPLIEAYGIGPVQPRRGVRIKHRGFVEAVRFLKNFWKLPLARKETVTRIKIDYLGNVTLTLGAGPEIKLGRDPLKHLHDLEKAAHLLEREERYLIEYIDLRFDDVIVKRKE